MAGGRDAIKEAVSNIEAGVKLLLKAGHPNVPSLLRRFAKDIERLGANPPPDSTDPPPPSAKVIRLSDWLPLDDAGGT